MRVPTAIVSMSEISPRTQSLAHRDSTVTPCPGRSDRLRCSRTRQTPSPGMLIAMKGRTARRGRWPTRQPSLTRSIEHVSFGWHVSEGYRAEVAST